tara:strand:+ start:525 stop:677 length:153 start_codon:yes stop_codon:yes gene_type:complete
MFTSLGSADGVTQQERHDSGDLHVAKGVERAVFKARAPNATFQGEVVRGA